MKQKNLPINKVAELKKGQQVKTFLDGKYEDEAIILEIGESKPTKYFSEITEPYYDYLRGVYSGTITKTLDKKFLVGVLRCKVRKLSDNFICWRNIPYILKVNPTPSQFNEKEEDLDENFLQPFNDDDNLIF